jgi:pyruvate/2-oxoglutarate dehydrogenase complex dihydrolipoamide dehydrogenase (E3) component
MARVVVVGGGVAGVSAALAASRRGAKTTLVESSRRVGLSKVLLPSLVSGELSEEELALPEAGSLSNAGVEVRAGEAVTSVAYGERKVRVDGPSSAGRGRSIGFDSLVICTGAASQVPQIRGISKPNVFVLGGVADYLKLAAGLAAFQTIVVSGPVPLALKLGEILAGKGIRVQVYCGKGGLARQFSVPVAGAIRRQLSARGRTQSVILVDDTIDSILGVEKAEAVVSSGSVRTCDGVVVIPRSISSTHVVDCERGRNGGLLVDASMSTSLPGVFAAGDCAELRFKSGSVPARLYSTSRMGGEVAGINAAGGRAFAAPSWSVEESFFGLEYCSSGLTEEDAKEMGLDAATQTSRTSGVRSDPGRETFVSMVYDRDTRQVYGVEVAGWRASSLSSAASLVVSMGLTVEQLLHVESPYLPGSGFDVSPIALTARKILGPEGT